MFTGTNWETVLIFPIFRVFSACLEIQTFIKMSETLHCLHPNGKRTKIVLVKTLLM